MRKLWLITWLFSGLLAGNLSVRAQFDPDKICHIQDGRLVFTLNLKWSEKEKQQLFVLFDLDSTLLAQVYSGKTAVSIKGDNWEVRKIRPGIIELSKPLNIATGKEVGGTDLFNKIDEWMNFRGNETDVNEVFGLNDFKISSAFVYTGTQAQFYLPGFVHATRVCIAGTFNNWSTNSFPMKFIGKGWVTDLKLKPGKYAYKFIVDGRWFIDPSNNLKERGDAGAYNSVVFCPNHSFNLKGFTNVKKVVVTGNFYRWNRQGLPMMRVPGGWRLPVWFRDGTYVYKFLADNRWMADPANPKTKNDANGNLNSFLEIGEPFLFNLKGFKDAEKVILTGSFNGWDKGELLMNKTADGWQLNYVVPPGNYEYKFIADNTWIADPDNPFTSGSGNAKNSFIALKANHVFELHGFPNATEVIVTGSFNGWKPNGYRMVSQEGRWILPFCLKPGKYTYKFIVDGKWILDPDNKLYEKNEYGTGNSVLWVDPGK